MTSVTRSLTPGAELRLSVPPDPRQSIYVRREMLAFAELHGISDDAIIDFVSAIGEALANAIEHGFTTEPIEVMAWLPGEDRLFASVLDKGVGFTPAERNSVPLPDAFAERGRGLPIMRECADVFNLRSAPGEGTHVTLGCFVRREARCAARETAAG